MTRHEQKRNGMIDIMRFAICPLIVFIHCPFPGMMGQNIITFGRFGVPFFLLLSGWFSYRPNRDAMIKQARKKLLDTVKLILWFIAAYLVMNSVAAAIAGKHPFSWILYYCNRTTLVHLLLFNRALFLGSTGYYPFMLLYVYVVFLMLLALDQINTAVMASPILLLITVVAGEFTGVSWYYYGNFLFTGIPFFFGGHYLHKHQKRLRFNVSSWLTLFLIGTIASFAEAYYLQPAYCFLGSIIMAVSALMLALNSNWSAQNQSWILRMQRYSTYIFIIHCGVRDIINAYFQKNGQSCSPYMLPWIVLFCSLALCIVWDVLNTMRKQVTASLHLKQKNETFY